MKRRGFIIVTFISLVVISPWTTVLPLIYTTYAVLWKKVDLHKNYWNMGLFSLFVWSIIVGILNRSTMSILASFAFLIYFCLSVFIQNYCTSESKVETICRSLLQVSIFSAVLGIIEKIMYLTTGFELWKRVSELIGQPIFGDRINSTFGNPNVAGNWFAIMIIVSLYFTDISKKSEKKIYSAVTVLFVIVLFLTGSRGAYIGVVCGLSMFLLLKKNKKDVLTIGLVCLFTATLIVIPTNLLDFNDTVGKQVISPVDNEKTVNNVEDNHEVDDSVNSRLGIWLGAMKMIEDKPVAGWGLMAFLNPHTEYLGEYYYDTLYHAHNIWITFTATLGSVGLIIYLYMKFNLFKDLKLLYQRNSRLTAMLAGIEVLILGHGMVDFTMIAPQTGIMFIGCSAIISTLALQYSHSSSKVPLFVKKYKSLTSGLTKNSRV